MTAVRQFHHHPRAVDTKLGQRRPAVAARRKCCRRSISDRRRARVGAPPPSAWRRGSSGRCCNAPRALLHIAARPDARIAAHCCSRTALCSNGIKAGPNRPRSIFAARLPQTASNGESDVAVSLRISTRKKISGYDRHETNPNLLLVQEVPVYKANLHFRASWIGLCGEIAARSGESFLTARSGQSFIAVLALVAFLAAGSGRTLVTGLAARC